MIRDDLRNAYTFLSGEIEMLGGNRLTPFLITNDAVKVEKAIERVDELIELHRSISHMLLVIRLQLVKSLPDENGVVRETR